MDLATWLGGFELHTWAQSVTLDHPDRGLSVQCTLQPKALEQLMPGHDTLGLHQRLSQTQDDRPNWTLEREITVALLGSPHLFSFANLAALQSHIRVRRNMVLAARKTALAFKTEAAERPEADWQYQDGPGFILKPGRPLIAALVAATQPEATGKLYDFSCYRATEYVILLGIAQELAAHHPALLADLQQLNERHAVRSGQFHDVFLIEYGSMAAPLPSRFYVPGDRLWFRNPDERSSDIEGYEGSWVIYMGGGLFSNFWQRDRPFTLESKAIEIFHWRHGATVDSQGQLVMDESVVEQHVARTERDPQARQQVLERMVRMRDPQGVYAEGGCIDATREHPRSVSRDDCQLVLPTF
ncbi:MAG: hypothetical protein LW702_15025 [Comamonadaceae bacterium]|nr:hypothetical protein [Comamonadaceae bacterium]